MDNENCFDSVERLAEMEKEEADARNFGITVEELRKQRRSLGQLLTGPYAGCSIGFASMMESQKEIAGFLAEVQADNDL